ncbi:MAG: C_GCAxxG_C_C family protein [Clostridia bacterium]|nr:C_GCAxxG_C_C family protein [Clostridia bacterium]
MKDYPKIATELFLSGYNCAQSVLCAFSDVTNVDEETAKKMASSFGGGMGRMRYVCGAVSGMLMVLGIVFGYTDTESDTDKLAHYKLVQEKMRQFIGHFGSVTCSELIKTKDDNFVPTPRNEEFYKARPCAKYVWYCAEILQEELAKQGKIK